MVNAEGCVGCSGGWVRAVWGGAGVCWRGLWCWWLPLFRWVIRVRCGLWRLRAARLQRRGGGVGVESQSQSTADSSSCPYGRRADGTCRACPQLDHYHNGNRCVPKPSSGQRCPSGQTYYSSYGGCRPSPCTYGRTSSGYCNPRPSCPAGQTYFSQYGGCRPSNCGKPGRSSTGYCRTCTDPTHYHNGDACVPKTAPAPGDPSCPTGQLYYGSYGGCRPSSCTHGRTTSGYCNPPPTTTTPPTSTTTTTTTTTTTASCPEGQEYFSRYGGCRPSSCEHDRSSTGHCRACADPTHYHNGQRCVPKTAPAPGDPTCPAGQLYYGHYKKCRPSSCTLGRASNGDCRQPPTTTTTTATTTITFSCPEGQSYFSDHNGCRPVSCGSVRLDTGYCSESEIPENPWHVSLKCWNYSMSGDATWYLNMDRKERLSNTGIIAETDIQAFRSGRNCPVMGLFRAGAIQRGISTSKSETYPIVLGYNKSIYEGYPVGAENPEFDPYGLVTMKIVPYSDQCSHPFAGSVANSYDRRLPCQAHDYCYDLIRFAVAPGLSKGDCDDRFHDLMNSDCADRGRFRNQCQNTAGEWRFGVRFNNLSNDIIPGVIIIQNAETGMCVNVEGGSKENNTPLAQWPCKDKNGQISKHWQFRFFPHWLQGTFRIQPEHTLSINNCVVVPNNKGVVLSTPDFCRHTTSSLFRLVSAGEGLYTIRQLESPDRCWIPETSDQGSRLINSSPCHRDSDLHLWEIREVEG